MQLYVDNNLSISFTILANASQKRHPAILSSIVQRWSFIVVRRQSKRLSMDAHRYIDARFSMNDSRLTIIDERSSMNNKWVSPFSHASAVAKTVPLRVTKVHGHHMIRATQLQRLRSISDIRSVQGVFGYSQWSVGWQVGIAANQICNDLQRFHVHPCAYLFDLSSICEELSRFLNCLLWGIIYFVCVIEFVCVGLWVCSSFIDIRSSVTANGMVVTKN